MTINARYAKLSFNMCVHITSVFVLFHSINDMDVKDPMPNAKAPVIVSKVEQHKDIMLLDVSVVCVCVCVCGWVGGCGCA